MYVEGFDTGFDAGEEVYYVQGEYLPEKCECCGQMLGTEKYGITVKKSKIDMLYASGTKLPNGAIDLRHPLQFGARLDNGFCMDLKYLFKTQEEAEANMSGENVWNR